MGSAPDDSEFITSGFTDPEVEARYRRFLQDNWGEIDIPRLCEVFANFGGRRAVEAMVVFSDLPPLVRRIEQSCARIRSLLEGMTDGAR